MHRNPFTSTYAKESHFVHSTGPKPSGGRRCFVACSYPYAYLISSPSLNDLPTNVSPAGSESYVNPIGTVIAGNPVCGDNTWLLSPAGLFTSPTLRGGLLHVG